jgi:hypothetical protein
MNHLDMDPHAREAFESVLHFAGLAGMDTARVDIAGADPDVPSRFRLGSASAGALAAHAVGIGEIWKLRGGLAQQISIDLRRAAYPGLCTFLHLQANGHPVPFFRYEDQRRNFFATKDGRRFYLLYTANYIQHCLRLHRFLGATTSSDSIARAVAQWDAQALEDSLAEVKLIGAMARTREEWLRHPQGALLADKPAVEVERLAPSEAEPFKPAQRPLSGVRILDMAHVLAGAVTARVLAEQGAEVLHVSAAHQPDGQTIDIDTGFGKRSAFINLDVPQDAERLRELIRQSDVFVQSWRPGALSRRGFSPAEVADIRPGIIYVSLSCYGTEGPWATRGGYEPLGQTVSGLAIGEGSQEEPMLACTFTLNDYLTAYLAAAGTVGALLRRSREGGSYHVKASLTQTSMWVQALGRLPEASWPGAPQGVSQFPALPETDFARTDSVFGEIRHPRPIVEYSGSPAFWSKAPTPAGASLPAWTAGEQR